MPSACSASEPLPGVILRPMSGYAILCFVCTKPARFLPKMKVVVIEASTMSASLVSQDTISNIVAWWVAPIQSATQWF